MQVAQGDEEPVALTKVYHSKAFIEQAAAMKIHLDLPEEEEQGNDPKEISDEEPQKVKAAPKVRGRAKREAYVELDSEVEAEEPKKPSKGPSKRKRKADEGLDVDMEKESKPKGKQRKRHT